MSLLFLKTIHVIDPERNPTDAQKKAGNYRMGHIRWNGLDITIEVPKGGYRSGPGWRVKMPHHYGYVRGTQGVDGDHVDVFIGPDLDSPVVYVVNQQNPDGTFDEHKCMIGFRTPEAAKAAYLAAYTSDWKGFHSMTAMDVPRWKQWLQEVKPGKAELAKSCHNADRALFLSATEQHRHGAKVCLRCGRLTPDDRPAFDRAFRLAPTAKRLPMGLMLKAIATGCYKDPQSCNLRWITAHPNGDDTTGVPLLVHDNGTEYSVVGGAKGRLNHMVLPKGQSDKEAKAAKKQRVDKAKAERLAELGETAEQAREKAKVLRHEVKTQTADLHNRVLVALHEKLQGDALGKVAEEAKKQAQALHPNATDEQKERFVQQAVKEATTEAKQQTRKVIDRALDRQALRSMGDDDDTPEQFQAKIAGIAITKDLTPQQLEEFVKAETDIAALKAKAKAIQRALQTGDAQALQHVDTLVTPLSDEEVKRQNLERYLDGKSVDANVALVKGAEQASVPSQRRHQANGAADGLNVFAASLTGQAILDPQKVQRLGTEGAARVAAAYLKENGVEGKVQAEALRDRMETTSYSSVAAAMQTVEEMNRLVDQTKEAAATGDGTVTKAQASILAANMAAQRYRLLNTTLGQLRAAQALAQHLERPSDKPLTLGTATTEIAAHQQAKGWGLKEGEYDITPDKKGFVVSVPADKLSSLARPQDLAESSRSLAMDRIREEVQRNPGGWHPQGFNPNARLMPHQELAAKAITENKRIVLNYGAGSGKTPTAYAAAADLLSSGKVDKVLMTMPAKPRAQQAGPTGEAAKFLTAELASKVAVVQDGADLTRQLKRVKSGEAQILICSPHLMREHVQEFKDAGFGGEHSMFFADEAHEFAIGAGEGKGSGMAQAAREMAKSEYAVAASGTLIENNASELHSVYDMIHPGQLGGQKSFSEEWRRLSQGGQDFFSGEAMQRMRDRLSSGMLSYHKPVAGPSGEPLTLTRNTLTVPTSEAQKAAIAKANAQYQKDKKNPDAAKAKAAALKRDAAIKRILTAGVKNEKGEMESPKMDAVRAIADAEKGRAVDSRFAHEPAIQAAQHGADPHNRVGVYAFERAPLRAAGKALGGNLASITGEDDDRATKQAVARINDRTNDTDGVLLSNAANYGVNLQGMDHLVKLHPLDVPSKEDQLDHRHFRTGQTRNVRATTILTDHPTEQATQFRTTRVKLPEVALLASLADSTGASSLLGQHLDTLKEVAHAPHA